jgi:beta,beta-carotene 9',10'-dioxygenase
MGTTTEKIRTASRVLGFQSMDEEVVGADLPVTGQIPTWLSGRAVRVTPALLDVGGKPVGHWFDGIPMLNAFSFRGGKVSYTSRFIDTPTYRAAQSGRLDYGISVGTDPTRPLTQRVKALWDDDQLTFGPSVNVVRTGGRYLATTETPTPYEFDPDTLETKARLAYRDRIGGRMGGFSHPHFDPRDGSMLAYTTTIGIRNEHKLFSAAPGSMNRTLIARWPAGWNPAYMHSFSLTERYAVMLELPMKYSPIRLLTTGTLFRDSTTWQPDGGTPFRVIDRGTGAVRTHECQPFFYWHTVNAFETGNELVVDVVASDGPTVWDLDVERLRDPDYRPNFGGYLTRFRLPVAGGPVRGERLSDLRCEFPQINYGRCNTRDYRYVYMVAYAGPRSDWFDELVKVDVTTGETKRWSEDGCYTSEPMIAPAPNGSAEDDCVVMSVVLDSRSGRSFLLLLDGSSFEELGRAEAPHHIPFNFHQQYLD